MRTFACARCDQLVFFENTQCLSCGAELQLAVAEAAKRRLLFELGELCGSPAATRISRAGSRSTCSPARKRP